MQAAGAFGNLASLPAAYGLARSLLIYYGVPLRLARWRAFYRQFVRPMAAPTLVRRRAHRMAATLIRSVETLSGFRPISLRTA